MLGIMASMALLAAAPADATETRAVVESVAEAIERTYFDPEAAARIGTELRQQIRSGHFEGLGPHQLANRLSEQLRRHDRHFNVSYAPPVPTSATNGAPPSAYGHEEADRRSGYGFRQVEVLPGNIGYIDLRSFAPIDFSDPEWPARRAADAALALVGRTDALIIDLRANGGGDPGMVGYLASAFVGPERDVYNVFHARDRRQSERPPVPYPNATLQMPVYVLVGARTGSAAEAFAYTLQAAERATIVGAPSAGAANPGGELDVGNGWRIFVSDATPINVLTGGNWEGTGVIPDLPAEPGEALLRAQIAALEAALPRLPEAERPDAALTLEALRAQAAPGPADDLDAYAGTYETVTVAREDSRLVVRVGRRPPTILGPLGEGVFYSVDNPSTRFVFRDDGTGGTERLEIRWVDGHRSEYRRGAAG